MSAIPAPDQPYQRPADPAALVGRWVRVDDRAPASVGVLEHARRTGGGAGWEWELRTSDGVVSGRGPLAARPLTETADLRSARRRLRAELADLAEFGAPDDPALARAAADLDLLELEAAARP
ncbi:hypothetical protein ACOQFV_20770 [Nocardiopsis changdeensis]|uniref:Uncharacterized protein n=1 Tax=Nocardiopsis changdeensis TaxID=2831969 RepID=A0ABX8BIH1_9ACTN|nr:MULTISPECIES: hypothetical protein [Nocardiopsis]QUX20842.1 hypothetical protein KGD84_20465 [Nocardiopsis changdeensis]QYX36774.1 hypothetical protein K1J57_29920 [Nocardiopsis sp. MT53]